MTVEIDSKITESEWEVMRVVWAHQQVTSKEIIQVLEQKKAWKPATTKTFIGRLVKKQILNTEKIGNKFLYSTDLNEVDFVKNMLGELFDNVCNREKGGIMAYLLNDFVLSFDDIREIETALEKKRELAVDQVPCNCVPGQCHCHLKNKTEENENGEN